MYISIINITQYLNTVYQGRHKLKYNRVQYEHNEYNLTQLIVKAT